MHFDVVHGTSPGSLLLLEPLAHELQRPAVLGHRSDDLIRGSTRKHDLDLERDRDLRAHLPGQMRDHLVSDAAGVAADARGVEFDRAVEPTWRCLRNG